MPNQSKMACQLELSVCLPIYCICLSTVLHIFVKISYWGLCFLLTWMATRWSFLVICWWFANLWLLKSRNLKTLLGSSGWGSCGPCRERAEQLTCQGMEVCVKCKASVIFQPEPCLWNRNHKWRLIGEQTSQEQSVPTMQTVENREGVLPQLHAHGRGMEVCRTWRETTAHEVTHVLLPSSRARLVGRLSPLGPKGEV